ncbi:MAG: hypothetical protein N2321_04425, partial [Melioribacteraceae bacterium]|nr:hypothetical protein [Melioribacteraceae bacterium]
SKIAITDSSGYLSASSVESSELFTPAYAVMRHINNSTTITSDYSWEKYTGFTPDLTKNCSITNSTITVNSAGKYLISYSITYRANTNTGNTIIFDTFINNANSNYEIGKRSSIVRDTYNENINCTFLTTLTANSTIDLRMYSNDTDVITIVYATLSVIKISN